MIRPVAVLGAVVATLVVALGTADATAGRPHPPASAETPGSVTTVRSATVVCPDVSGGVGHGLTWVRAAGTSEVKPPQISATTVTADPKDFAPADKELSLIPYGTAFGGRVDAGSRALSFTATGSSAAGLNGVQVSRTTSGLSRGISATGCAAPGTQFTFVGGSTLEGDELRLVLTNIDDSAASVDVNLLGPSGAVSTPGSTGLMVAAHSRLTVDLAKLGPAETQLTTLVTAVTGRVAAAVLTTRRYGNIANGVEWIPDSGPASRRSVVPGMFADSGGRQSLVLANPGTEPANVTVQVVSDTSTFIPTALNGRVVAPSSVLTLDVTSALGGHPGALLVTADQPVLAGASQTFASSSAKPAEIAWSGQTASLSGRAVLPVVPIDSSTKRDVVLYLSSVHDDATVTLTPTGASSATPVVVRIPAGTTATADLGKLLKVKTGNLSVLVDANGPPVTVSAVFRETSAQGLMVAQVGLASVSGVIVLPSVVEDPTVAGVHPGEAAPSEGP